LRIGIVTCKPEKLADYFPTSAEPDLIPTEPPFTPDDQQLVDELRRRGHTVDPVIWGGEIGHLQQTFDRLVIRSPWDYMDSEEQRLGFMVWIKKLEQAGMNVSNPPGVMAWLTNKQYLLDLGETGIPVVPTRYVKPGSGVEVVDYYTGAMVIKPAISAAGAGLVCLETEEEAAAFQSRFAVLNAKQGYLIQPLIPEIRTAGEWSLIYLGGVYSHAIHKKPAPGKILCHAEQGGALHFGDAPERLRRVADQAVQQLPDAYNRRHPEAMQKSLFPLLYLRVDLIESEAGPLVSECEGVEPELFFRARPGSESDFADLLT
jgi:glutathione synthase/RimK-type ligase-like ATP-grasp enzyme